jgi:hypothetical protein
MQLGPEMSEAQRINAKMMRFMPFMFLVFLYFFSSALVLYWTVQNIMTIIQTLLTKNSVDLPKISTDSDDSSDRPDTKTKKSNKTEDYQELDEEQAKKRNLLGLKIKGKIDLSTLESRYEERMKNYSPEKLSAMSEQKKILAEEKRDKIKEAYKFLREELEKKS